MISNRTFHLMLVFVWPLIAFFIVLSFYNFWFDSLDKIKYDPTYSPEFDHAENFKSIIYWITIVFSLIIEIWLIKKYRILKINKSSNQL